MVVELMLKSYCDIIYNSYGKCLRTFAEGFLKKRKEGRNMRNIKKFLACLCAVSLVAGAANMTAVTDAAKKPKLSTSKLTVKVGQTKKVTVKNSAKKAKVTWKSSKSTIAKIVKKTSGKSAYAKVMGVKEGTAQVSATYKLGKKKSGVTTES